MSAEVPAEHNKKWSVFEKCVHKAVEIVLWLGTNIFTVASRKQNMVDKSCCRK
jgi:hypothetical protein